MSETSEQYKTRPQTYIAGKDSIAMHREAPQSLSYFNGALNWQTWQTGLFAFSPGLFSAARRLRSRHDASPGVASRDGSCRGASERTGSQDRLSPQEVK